VVTTALLAGNDSQNPAKNRKRQEQNMTDTHFNLKRGMLLAVALTALSFGTARALETQDYTDEKIKALIGDLGSEEFAKRETAEKELMKAGTKAQKALESSQQSTDAQVSATVKRLLGKLRWAQIKDVDYLSVLPAESIVYFNITSLKGMIDKFQNTALAKTGGSKGLEPLREKIQEQLNKKPEIKEKCEEWSKRFSAQIAGGIWEANLLAGPAGFKAGIVAQITDPVPQKVYADLLAETQFEEGAESGTYEDVSYLAKPNGAAIAQAGQHLFFAANVDSLKQLIDGFKTKTGVAASAAFKKIKTALGGNPDILTTVDYEGLLKIIAPFMMMQPGMDDVLTASGAKDIKQVAWASSISGDSFEDRFVGVMNGPPKGMAAISVPPAGVTPLSIASIVPANASGLAAFYVDGAKAYPAMMEYFAAMKKMPNNPDADVEAKIKEFEDKYGLKVSDLVSGVKGEIAGWLQLSADPAGAPDWGTIVTCASPDSAKALSEAFKKIINTETKVEAVKDADYKGRTIHQVDLEVLGAQLPPQVKYAPSWTVDGNRVLVGSTATLIQKVLTNIDTKAPGLLTQPDFVKAIGNFTAEERKGAVYYLDAKALLTAGATVGLPLLAANPGVSDDVKQVLGGLPAPAELFKEIGPMVAVQVVNGDESKVIVRAPVSPVVMIFLGLAGVGVSQARAMGVGGGF
jgi:hypothetical protein